MQLSMWRASHRRFVPINDLPNILKKRHDKLGLILYFREVPKMKNLVICTRVNLLLRWNILQ